jgi:hypothetical protein
MEQSVCLSATTASFIYRLETPAAECLRTSLQTAATSPDLGYQEWHRASKRLAAPSLSDRLQDREPK